MGKLPSASLKPGTQLVRQLEWPTIAVTVTEKGFPFEDRKIPLVVGDRAGGNRRALVRSSFFGLTANA
jgi:hypothetical protein